METDAQWTAVEEALSRLHGGATYWEHAEPFALFGFLEGSPARDSVVRAYALLEPEPHWHVVTLGASGGAAQVELSMRVARCEDDTEPYAWVYYLLQALAGELLEGALYGEQHHIHLVAGLEQTDGSRVRGVLLREDPTLGTIESSAGSVRFLEVVPVTEDELVAAEQWNTASVLDLLAAHHQLLLARPDAESRLTGSRDRVREGAERDGSSYGVHFCNALAIKLSKSALRVTLGACDARAMETWMRGRLARDRPVRLRGKNMTLVMVAAAEPGWRWIGKGELELRLDPSSIAELAEKVGPRRATVSIASVPGLELVVEPTSVRDGRGLLVSTYG